MAKTQDIKRRIRSVGNTMKLTRAMKLVSGSKLRRAQERMLRARPYARRMLHVLRSVAQRADVEAHPLLRVRPPERVELVVLTADKGLCGAFNANIVRHALSSVAQSGLPRPGIVAVGKKSREFFRRRGYALVGEWVDVFRTVDFGTAAEIAALLSERYIRQEVDRIDLVYNEFKSAIQCRPVVQQLLPLRAAEVRGAGPVEEYLYEPDAQQLFAELLPHYVENQVFQALLESVAAEHAARMTAMDSATKNAGELIETLTLKMNRVRQASITTELIEVVSGAQALG